MCSVTEIGYQSFGYKYTMIGVRVMTSYECGYVISGQLYIYRHMFINWQQNQLSFLCLSFLKLVSHGGYKSFVLQLAGLTGTSGA